MADSKENIKSLSDDKFFEQTFKEFFTPLSYYALKFTKDHDSAKDIVHGIFIRLWEKRDSISLDQPIKSYLYTAVHNSCLNYIRDRAKFVNNNASEMEYLNSHMAADSIDIETTETESRINDAINSLPEKCREVFRLSRFKELKYNEIAKQLNISVKTVETQMSKALRILREELKDYLVLLLWLTSKIFW